MVKKKVINKLKPFPKVNIDKENNFISIKFNKGIEAKSYLKKGILFSENTEGEVLEIQIVGDLIEIGDD